MTNNRETTRYITNLSNKIRRKLDAMSPSDKFSGTQGRILHYVLGYPDKDIYQKDVEEAFGLRSATATGILKKMEKNGLIIRTPTEYDARLKKIVPTKQALAYASEVNNGLEALEKALVNGINEEELRLFYNIINKMINNIS